MNMVNFCEMLPDKISQDYFTDVEISTLLPGTNNRRYGLVKRALAKGQLIRLRRGLYCLAERYRRRPLNLFVLAQKIYGPSYVSFQSALSTHGWIPEAVYTVTSASFKRSRDFSTPLGEFSFTCVPVRIFLAGVGLVRVGNEGFFLATPLRALADYVRAHKKNWCGVNPLIRDLRIEEADLATLKKSDFDELYPAFQSRRVQKFLRGVQKDLRL